MKNKFYILVIFVVTIFFSSCDKGELPIPAHSSGDVVTSQVDMGSDYRHQIFYNLESNSIVSQNLKTDWDLGFEASPYGWHVVLNSSRGGAATNSGTTDFTAVTTATGAAWAWDNQRGDMDSTAIGDWRSTGTVFIIDRGYDELGNHTGYRKAVFQQVNEHEYTFRYAKLDGTEEQSATIPKDSSLNFVSFSFDKNTVVTVEPPKKDWDLLFTQYTHVFPGPIAYLVTGALINPRQVTVAMDSTHSFAEISYGHISSYNFTDSLNSIGYDWKYYDFDLSTYILRPEINYIVHTSAGFYYKLHFIDFYSESGEKGAPKFELQKL